MCRSLQLTEFRSLQCTCRLNFAQAHVILKDSVVVDQTLVAVGMMAPLQESVLHLVANCSIGETLCVRVAGLRMSGALVLALTVALAFAVALDLALARENYL